MMPNQASSSCFVGPEAFVGIRVSTICSSISSWAVHEQNGLRQELPRYRQAELLLHGPDHLRAHYALNLVRKDPGTGTHWPHGS